MSVRFDRLCRDLFLLAQLTATEDQDRGARWERRIAEHLLRCGVRTEVLPGGCTFMGRASLSGLNHQIDGVIECQDGIVIGEWKAHRGFVPKNELLRFKAVSEDYYLALGSHAPRRPILRVFGGAAGVSDEVRRYAAQWGITVIDPTRWPSPVLASTRTVWPGTADPHPVDRRHLRWLSRPIQRTLERQSDGSYVVPRLPSRSSVDRLLDLQDRWSDQLWEDLDQTPGRFEHLVEGVCGVAA